MPKWNLVLTCSPTPSFPVPRRWRWRADSPKYVRMIVLIARGTKAPGGVPLAEQRALHRIRDTMFFANGYRFAKWQGKPNFALR